MRRTSSSHAWRTVAIATIVALGFSSVAAAAAAPSAATSTVDPCLRVCPGGDLTFHVLVRDENGHPIPGSFVDIGLCACPGVTLCPYAGTERYAVFGGCHAVQFTGPDGLADFQLRAGGVCSGVTIPVHADGVLLSSLTSVASSDQNGDQIANATDRIILLSKLAGPYDPTCDFNCSAGFDPGDRAIFEAHIDTVHWCFVIVPTLESSWGRLKTLYR
jgi:hypothetical protein